MRLYLEGKTQAVIAERLGFHRSQIGYDLEKIRKEWTQSTLVDCDEKKRIELDRIDVVERNAWERFERHGDEVGAARYLEIVLKCIERRCRIYGIDAPIKAEIEADINTLQTIAAPDECKDREEWLRLYGHHGSENN